MASPLLSGADCTSTGKTAAVVPVYGGVAVTIVKAQHVFAAEPEVPGWIEDSSRKYADFREGASAAIAVLAKFMLTRTES